MASVSKDAAGEETSVEVALGDEIFTASGVQILEKNFLEVYDFDKWTEKQIPNFQEGEELALRSLTVE